MKKPVIAPLVLFLISATEVQLQRPSLWLAHSAVFRSAPVPSYYPCRGICSRSSAMDRAIPLPYETEEFLVHLVAL
jgi:hypothetical protein